MKLSTPFFQKPVASRRHISLFSRNPSLRDNSLSFRKPVASRRHNSLSSRSSSLRDEIPPIPYFCYFCYFCKLRLPLNYNSFPHVFPISHCFILYDARPHGLLLVSQSEWLALLRRSRFLSSVQRTLRKEHCSFCEGWQ